MRALFVRATYGEIVLVGRLWTAPERIEPLLPGKVGDPGRTASDNRLFVHAVLYVLKTGIS